MILGLMYSLWRNGILLGRFVEREPTTHHGRRVGAMGILQPTESFVGISPVMQTRIRIFPGQPTFQSPFESMDFAARPAGSRSQPRAVALKPLSEKEACGVPREQIFEIRTEDGTAIDADLLVLHRCALADDLDPCVINDVWLVSYGVMPMSDAIDANVARDAEEGEIELLARIWYDGWQDAHARILPAALARFRTLDSFRDRLTGMLASVRVIGPVNEPAGFCVIKGDELYQLFVCQHARGSGVAAALVADAESRMAERDIELAWLTCAIGNDRAARFYEKQGWRRTGVVVSELDTPEGIFPLEVWRYEKHLR